MVMFMPVISSLWFGPNNLLLPLRSSKFSVHKYKLKVTISHMDWQWPAQMLSCSAHHQSCGGKSKHSLSWWQITDVTLHFAALGPFIYHLWWSCRDYKAYKQIRYKVLIKIKLHLQLQLGEGETMDAVVTHERGNRCCIQQTILAN